MAKVEQELIAKIKEINAIYKEVQKTLIENHQARYEKYSKSVPGELRKDDIAAEFYYSKLTENSDNHNLFVALTCREYPCELADLIFDCLDLRKYECGDGTTYTFDDRWEAGIGSLGNGDIKDI